jgi:hypothetical protein
MYITFQLQITQRAAARSKAIGLFGSRRIEIRFAGRGMSWLV